MGVDSKESKTRHFIVLEIDFDISCPNTFVGLRIPFFSREVQVHNDSAPSALLGQVVQHKLCSADAHTDHSEPERCNPPSSA